MCDQDAAKCSKAAICKLVEANFDTFFFIIVVVVVSGFAVVVVVVVVVVFVLAVGVVFVVLTANSSCCCSCGIQWSCCRQRVAVFVILEVVVRHCSRGCNPSFRHRCHLF